MYWSSLINYYRELDKEKFTHLLDEFKKIYGYDISDNEKIDEDYNYYYYTFNKELIRFLHKNF
ncbi:MAG: hypothetical protein QW474_01605 [Candidatus Aenigmatarchaeota archaeon]